MAVEILKMAGVTKRFPGVLALNNVNFTLEEGETHALVGANGAGKSTLIKTLAGVYSPDSGTIELRGEKQVFKRPMDAKQKGIAVIYQEFTLFPDLDVAKNIYFGMEPVYGKTGLVNWKKVYSQAKKLIERFGLELNIYSKIKDLSIAQQQMVEIAKALACNANILVMDEPTATLTISEVERLFEIIEDLKKKNVSIIYISHRLDEVVRISNRLTVLRSGTVVGSAVTGEITKNEIVKMMVGENINNDITPNPVVEQPLVMSVKNISNAFIHDISFDLKKGEVLGIAGLVGAGRTEVMRALFGADKIRSGEIIISGVKRSINRPKDAINCKIGLLPESRKAQGLFMNIRSEHLPVGQRKKHYKKTQAKRPPKGTSSERRPADILLRRDFGHWEMDCVVGRQYTRNVLLVLTERVTRYEIIMKMPNRKTATVVQYLDKLERRYGKKFRTLFKSITVDNGSEFSDFVGLERSVYGGGRTTVYYCHPYTSCERGSNERINRDIRRLLPKGTDFSKVSDKRVQEVARWVNAYPREIFGFGTSAELFTKQLSAL